MARREFSTDPATVERLSVAPPPVVDELLSDAIDAALAQLPPKQAEVIRLHEFAQMSFREVAVAMQLSLTHTHRLYSTAKAALAEVLQNVPAVRRRFAGTIDHWETAAAQAAVDIGAEASVGWTPQEALARLATLRDLAAEKYVRRDSSIIDDEELWIEIGSIGLSVWRATSGGTLSELVDQVIGKQRDYGTGNIAAFGEIGLTVRLSDKVARLQNLLGGGRTPTHEAITDTWMDIVGYSIVALLWFRNQFYLPLHQEAA
jgi:predicted DNA-binding protein (UPF0251 family)